MYGLLAAGTLTAALVMPMNVFAEEPEAQPPKETAVQEGEVTFSTDYPGVTVKPGGTSTFTLNITNTGSEETTVDLCAENLPEGWQGTFKGGANEKYPWYISVPVRKKEDSPSLSYSLSVPEDTKGKIPTRSH